MQESAEQAAGRMAVLRDLSRTLGATAEPRRAASVVSELLAPHLGKSVELWIREGSQLRLAASEPRDDTSGHPATVVHVSTSTLPGLAALEHRGVRSLELGADGHATQPGSVAAPFGAGAQVDGVLVVAAPESILGDDDVTFVEAVAIVVGSALASSRHFAEVMELERLKADFIARISHELRTPITIISGFLDTLIAHDATIEREDRLHMLERSQSASGRLADLIGDLLTLSKVETGMLRPNIVNIDLAGMLQQVAVPKSAEVSVDVPAGATLRSDRDLFERAVAPVIDNAVKYGSHVEVSVRSGDDGWVVVVEDDGPGIPDDVGEVIFEIFTRSSTTTNVPGLGLGLAVARTVVEAMGGSINIGSRDSGSGTRVRIALPDWP